MKRIYLLLVLVPLFFAAFPNIATAQNLVKNGTFEGSLSYREWTLTGIAPRVANKTTGGNPGGYLWLNTPGAAGNPSASQKLTGLQPWAEYVVEGDFRGGDDVKRYYDHPGREFFAADIDSRPIAIFTLPDPVTKWGKFSATFMAVSSSHTLRFRGEINGADADVALDNITVRLNNPEAQPRLLTSGSEGRRNNSEVAAGGQINLEVLFVDWADQPVTNTDFDGLWRAVTSNNTVLKAFQQHGVNVRVNLQKAWKRMPKNQTYYFPPSTDAKNWLWQDYTKHSVELLGQGADYPPNTIVVVVPNKGATGFKDVGSGAHGANGFRGVRRMITLVPQVYNEHYTTLMHEIGHCLGSGELYPLAQEPVPGKPKESAFMHEVAGYDLMGDVVYATGFMGWHRLRYGWLPKSRTQFLNTKGDHKIGLKKLSASSGKAMIVVPDPDKASKLWVIEIGQDVVSRDQFRTAKGRKLNAEGERIIVYTVEDPTVSADKRAIRLVPRTAFSPDHGTTQWLDAVSYKQGQTFNTAGAPFTFTVDSKITADGTNTVDSKKANGFALTVKLSKDIK